MEAARRHSPGSRRCERHRVHCGSTRTNIEEHVVELWIVAYAEAAADHRLVFGKESKTGSPGKTEHRPEVVPSFRNVGHCAQAERNRRSCDWIGVRPEGIRSGLISHATVMQKIDSLLVPLPAQPQVESEVVFNPPVVLKVSRYIFFLEGQFRISDRNASLCGIVGHQIV